MSVAIVFLLPYTIFMRNIGKCFVLVGFFDFLKTKAKKAKTVP